MRHDSTGSAILGVLRRHLRKDGWTALRVAGALSIGEATAKRWMAGKGLTLDRLERMAALVGLSLGDLAREAEEGAEGLAQELTLAQERALSSDIFLSFLFITIMHGVPPAETAADFSVPAPMMEAALTRLERLALIDRLRNGRVRPLVDRTMLFRKLPLRALFEHNMKPHFFALDYSSPDTVYNSEVVKLSRVGMAQLAELMERFRADVMALADRDRETAALGREWIGLLCVMCELDMGPIRAAANAEAARD